MNLLLLSEKILDKNSVPAASATLRSNSSFLPASIAAHIVDDIILYCGVLCNQPNGA
jgi:hypothetical protein